MTLHSISTRPFVLNHEITLCACLDARLRAYARLITTMRANPATREYEPVASADEIAEAAELVRSARAELALHWATQGDHV